MTLLSTKQLRGIQRLGEMGMNVDVKIFSRKPQVKDPTNLYGDEDVMFETVSEATTVKGWLVTKPTERFDIGGGQVRTIATHQLRVPVGTSILAGDEVKIGDERFVVTDATNEQSWPEWTVAYLRGYENGG